ncbi:MAG: hypothetical protein WBP93_19165 [Pyrinomonadaceae bacterium]
MVKHIKMFAAFFLILLLMVSILPFITLKAASSNLILQKGTEEEWRQFFRRVVGCDENKTCSRRMTIDNLAAWFERLLAKKNRKGGNLTYTDLYVSRDFFGGSTFGSVRNDGHGRLMLVFPSGADYTPIVVKKEDVSGDDLIILGFDGKHYSREISPHDFAKMAVEYMKYPTEDEFITYVNSKQEDSASATKTKPPSSPIKATPSSINLSGVIWETDSIVLPASITGDTDSSVTTAKRYYYFDKEAKVTAITVFSKSGGVELKLVPDLVDLGDGLKYRDRYRYVPTSPDSSSIEFSGSYTVKGNKLSFEIPNHYTVNAIIYDDRIEGTLTDTDGKKSKWIITQRPPKDE